MTRPPMTTVVMALLCGTALAASPAVAQPDGHEESAARLYRLGLRLHKEATRLGPTPEGRTYLRIAAEAYRGASELRPDFYEAHRQRGVCAMQQAQATEDRQQRLGLYPAMQEHFATAENCSDVDWKLYELWARTLAFDIAADRTGVEEKRRAFQRALQLLEKGRGLAGFSKEQGRLERMLALVYYEYAGLADDAAEESALLRRADERFERVESVPDLLTSEDRITWGITLLRLGGRTTNRPLIHQSIQQLRKALPEDPNNPEAHYNLACGYSLLGQIDTALDHLQLCLDHDPDGHYYQSALHDTDLMNLLSAPEFREFDESIKTPGRDEEKTSPLLPEPPPVTDR